MGSCGLVSAALVPRSCLVACWVSRHQTSLSQNVALRCRAAFIRSEFGLVPPEMAGTIDALLGHRVPIVELPDAGHHPMLDQPLPLVTALRMLVQQWAVS